MSIKRLSQDMAFTVLIEIEAAVRKLQRGVGEETGDYGH